MKGRDYYIHYIEKNKEGVNMKTHEEILEEIKERRELAQEVVALCESIQDEACKESWITSKALVMTIDRFSSDAVKNRAAAKALLNVITETMSDDFFELLEITTLIL